MLDAQEPYGIGALIGCRVAVQEITHRFVEVALPMLCRSEKGRRAFALGRRLLRQEVGQGEVSRGGAKRVREPSREAGWQIANAGGGRCRGVEGGQMVGFGGGAGGSFGASAGAWYIDWLYYYRRFIHVDRSVSMIREGSGIRRAAGCSFASVILVLVYREKFARFSGFRSRCLIRIRGFWRR